MTVYYQDVLHQIHYLSLSEQLQLLERLSLLVRQRVEQSEADVNTEHSIMELDGLGADCWQGVDAQHYVHEERAAWDS
jgi:hypothetical protein